MGDLEVRLKYKKDERDDWTKVEDRALRKKIQNRLAKRKNRDDARKNKHKPEQPTSPPTTDECRHSPTNVPASVPDEDELHMAVFGKPFSVKRVAAETANLNFRLRAYLALPALTEHRFLQLPQYSLLRAFVRNAEMLGLDPFMFYDDDAVSPWTTSNSISIPGRHSLNPTVIQLGTPHHPYLDVIAVPSMRDNMIVAGLTDEQEDEICHDMHENSFSVWGSQPWNSMSWEVSQSFTDKWWWMLGDEVIAQSDFWRAERGESPLKVPMLDVCEIIEDNE